MDLIQNITVERRLPTQFHVSWQADFTEQPVRVYAAAQPAKIEQVGAVATSASGAVEVNVPTGPRRWYFLLVPASDPSIVVSERNVPLVGGINFRDIGGYQTDDGRRLRWGRLFRSGHMANLVQADKQVVAELGLSTICDFRIAEESAKEKTELPGEPVQHILGIMPGIGDKQFFHRLFASATDPSEVTAAVHQMLACLVRDAAPFYARLFEVLLDNPPGAVLLNCSAGKERTGVATALLLAALGVPRETIMYDFMLSQKYFPAHAEVPRVRIKYAVSAEGARGDALIMPLLETRRSYLEAAFAAIDEDYGTTGAFLRARYGLDEAKLSRLRDLYTE